MRALQGLKCFDSHHKSQWKEYWSYVKIVSIHMPPLIIFQSCHHFLSMTILCRSDYSSPTSVSPAGDSLALGQPHQFSLLTLLLLPTTITQHRWASLLVGLSYSLKDLAATSWVFQDGGEVQRCLGASPDSELRGHFLKVIWRTLCGAGIRTGVSRIQCKCLGPCIISLSVFPPFCLELWLKVCFYN